MLIIVVTVVSGGGIVSAQESSINAFSPYTMYGIGDLMQGGTAEYRSMGGIGVGVYDGGVSFNYANPASLSAIPQRSALMNIGAEVRNFYLRSPSARTSHNSVNLNNLGFAFPLARGVGLGVALTPVSSVGYYNLVEDNSPSIVDNIGKVVYSYMGDGGVSQVQASLGVRITRGLSLGITGHYYFGTLNRYYNADMYSYLEDRAYRSVASTRSTNISKFLVSIGAQYMFRVGKEASLTFGATYQPKAVISARETTRTMSFVGNSRDTVASAVSRTAITIPARLAVGMHFQGAHLGFGVDYIRQDWTGAFTDADMSARGINLRTYQEFRAGVSYTPNRLAIRNFLNRWTYKIGGRYGTSYLSNGTEPMVDYALTLGVEIPMRRGSLTHVSVGGEIGQRGSTRTNYAREQYWKVFVGFTLFGDDMWFTKVKFD